MCQKTKRLFVWCLIASMLLVQICFTNTIFAATAVQKNRVYGADRIQTAIEISKAGWKTSSDYAILVTANDYPDALCAAPLAKLYNAPLLLTESNVLSSNVKSELQRLSVKNVIIVGGTGVVSENVFNSVRAIANVQRIAGNDREETSVEVAKKLGLTTKVVLATGFDFPDALSISSIAAAKCMPILLTERDVLSSKVENYIRDNGINTTYIVGGTGVISTAVEARLPGPIRLAGANRVQTNFEILNRFASELDFSRIYIATALDFPDALAGSALAAMTSSPIVLADSGVITQTKSLIKNKVGQNAEAIALGGYTVVADNTVDSIISAVNGSIEPAGTLRIDYVSAISRNYIKVVFNKTVDQVSAEKPQNYSISGSTLTENDRLMLQPDKKTLLIVLDNPISQNEKKLFTVKDKVIYSEDKVSTMSQYDGEITFLDVTVPIISSVTANGDKKLTIEFTEPVKIPSSFTTGLETLMKIDGQYIVNFGFTGAKAVNPTGVNLYSNKIEIMFSTSLPFGTHSLVIPAGTSEQLIDPSGFMVAKSTISFTVDSNISGPRVVNVTGETNGTVYVTYDRAMDSVTAQGEYLYSINSTPAMAADFKPGTGSKVVKVVFGPSVVQRGANILEIDKDIKDENSYILDADNDIRYGFTADVDITKPTVETVSIVDSKRIRVKFSEPMDYEYATKTSNYVLKDSTGLELSNVSAVSSEVGNAYTDTFTITLNTALTGSNYTLTIKNMVDRAATPNTMNEYSTTLNGFDDEAPTLTEEVLVSGSSSELVVYFSESMDKDTITNKNNLFYKDGNDSFKALPYSATVEPGIDNKSIIVAFPAGYTVKAYGWSGQYDVKGIRVANVKDAAGNLLTDVVGYKDVIAASNATIKPTYVTNTFKVYADSSKVWAEFELSQPLAILYISDFRVDGRTPDAGYVNGSRVTLTYTSQEKMTAIKLAGPNARLYSVSSSSMSEAGTRLSTIPMTDVYDDQISPEIVSVTAVDGGATDDTVIVTFSEKIDDAAAGLYIDNFDFQGGGTSIIPNYVTVSGDKVTYYFNSSSFNRGDSVRVKANANKISIRDLKDVSGNQTLYKPMLSDLSGISATVQ